jgi:hypothetical protein
MTSKIGQKATVTNSNSQINGKSGIVTFERENVIGVEIDGKIEYMPIEMTDIYDRKAAEYAEWVKDQRIAFLQNEGYFETSSKVIECETFDHWLALAKKRHPFHATEPFQKSDLGYGL